MEGCFMFQWGGCFSDEGGLIFKAMRGASVLVGGGFRKNHKIRGAPAPPTMGNPGKPCKPSLTNLKSLEHLQHA